ncbi:hypothetical protein D3C73_16980 [compost metagenome]
MTKKQKNTQRSASNTSQRQGAFGSGPLSQRFTINKKVYLLVPVLVVGVGLYLGVSNNYLGLFNKSDDVEKGLVQATETKEFPASSVPTPAQDVQPSSSTSAPVADAEAGVEGESIDAPAETSQMSDGEEAAVDRAAAVDAQIDNHEVEVLGGGN